MNIFYEESGQFKVAAVVQKNDSTYQVDTQHGKRVKVKSANVFIEFNEPMDAFLAAAQDEAAQIDTQLLWEVCGEDEFSGEAIAAEYFGASPGKVQLAATLMALYAAPMYFYKKAKGVFKAAPEETLKQALAALERKKQQDAQMQEWIDALCRGELPDAVAAELKPILHAPDKQSLAYKAFAKAADALKLSAYELAKQVGGIVSLPQYLRDRFEMKHFPKGTGFADFPVAELPELPLAEGVRAFSVDDADTTEIDDALSVQELGNGVKRVGVHIAAPSLGIGAGSALEQTVFERMSTAYFPGGKITMLPEAQIAAFSLDEGSVRPAFSIYFDVDAEWNVSEPHSRIEMVQIERNLRIHEIEPFFNSESGTGSPDAPQFAFHAEMIYLHALAQARQQARDRCDSGLPKRYDYSIVLGDDGKVSVGRRERGSPIDTVVSEMMILANSSWAKMLDDNGMGGIFRVQPAGRVRMSTKSEPHIGMNLQHYGWFTSPLRRASDYVNQKQLQALLDGTEPRFAANDAMLFATLGSFESAYAAYGDFQTTMEAYWSLVYLQQEGIAELTATVLKEDLVRVEGLPLVARVTGLPLEAAPKTPVRVAVSEVDAEKQFVALKYVNMAPAAL